ncbi:hypothetical protein CH252_39725 [Rhodococcus sp. 06-1477-1B]|nr:hypothetical protein CH252_39725 [Rhodococcus sp. 06-1477-1B]
MSGPDDRADDPDEVTLWAGRLRSWPVPPVVEDDVADDTILSRREAPEDETFRSRDAAPDDATVISQREAPADATVVSQREAPEDETIRSRNVAPDDETVISQREEPDDATVISPPAPPATLVAHDPLDDELGTTAPRRAPTVTTPGAGSGDPGLDETIRRGPTAAPVDADTDATLRRAPAEAAGSDLDEVTRHRPSAPAPLDEATRARPAPETEDDTASGSRRRRREASAAAEPVVPGGVRDARVPEALVRESYGPRREGPARVDRAPAVRRTSAQDAAAIRPRARRGAGRVVVLVSVIVVVLVASAIGAVLLLTT